MTNKQTQPTVTRRKAILSIAATTAASGCIGGENKINTEEDKTSKILRKDDTQMTVSPHSTHPKELLLTPSETDGEFLYIDEPKSNIDTQSHYYSGDNILTTLSTIGTALEKTSLKQNISITQSPEKAKDSYQQIREKIRTRYTNNPTLQSTSLGAKSEKSQVNPTRTDQIMRLSNYVVHTVLFDTTDSKTIDTYTEKIEEKIQNA